MAKRKKNPSWSQEERYILKKYYGVVPLSELTIMLPGRTEKSIYNQVHYLRKRKWTFNRKLNE